MYCAPVRDVTGNQPVKSECTVDDARIILVYACETVWSDCTGEQFMLSMSEVSSVSNMSIGMCVDRCP